MRRLLIPLLLLSLPLAAAAQQRPLTTEEAETVRPGELFLQFGVEFLQDARFPLSGLEGDLTRAGIVDLRYGVSRAAEIQIQGVIRNFLSVQEQRPAVVTPNLSRGDTSTSDFGDFTIAAKFRLLPETDRRPAIAIRFATELPNSDEARGIGANTTNFFFTLLAQKHIGRLNLFGNVGLGILQAPAGLFSQNDVILYGAAATYPLHEKLTLVGEVAGHKSTRRTSPASALVGTGSRSQARLGVQFFAVGMRWHFAGIAGLTKNDPDSGFTFGVSKSIRLWPDYDPPH
ncbi:MAG: transporter [Acidobacteria bacterium]|nr:transporter [Acidobacteriota bacterium]